MEWKNVLTVTDSATGESDKLVSSSKFIKLYLLLFADIFLLVSSNFLNSNSLMKSLHGSVRSSGFIGSFVQFLNDLPLTWNSYSHCLSMSKIHVCRMLVDLIFSVSNSTYSNLSGLWLEKSVLQGDECSYPCSYLCPHPATVAQPPNIMSPFSGTGQQRVGYQLWIHSIVPKFWAFSHAVAAEKGSIW